MDVSVGLRVIFHRVGENYLFCLVPCELFRRLGVPFSWELHTNVQGAHVWHGVYAYVPRFTLSTFVMVYCSQKVYFFTSNSLLIFMAQAGQI